MTANESSADRRSRKSSERAGRMAGASGRNVEKAKSIARYAPELMDKVTSGEMSLDAAYKETRRLAAQGREAGAEYGPRSRIGERIKRTITQPCPHCHGSGRIEKQRTEGD